MSGPSRHRVAVGDLGFSAAHFIAFPGFREPLHGHNYLVSVVIEADVGPDGFVLDFLVVKREAAALCATLHDRVLLPASSDCLRVDAGADVVDVVAEDGARFRFPRADVRLLPIVHTSAEEIAGHLLARLRDALADATRGRALREIEVGVAETPSQWAYCRAPW